MSNHYSYPERTSSYNRRQDHTENWQSEFYTNQQEAANDSQYSHQRPLIDFVTNDWKQNIKYSDHLSDISDDEKHFFTSEVDTLLPPHWVKHIPACQVPRRVQRYLGLYLLFLFGLLTYWLYCLRPAWAYQALLDESLKLERAQGRTFGHNIRPEFKDMIQLGKLDPKFLPGHKGQEHRRLVFVGDVHGCLTELEDLLQKVSFDTKHDHLVLTGDIIAKGPDSKGVVDLARSLGASCVRGNHEDRTLLAHASLHRHQKPLLIANDGDKAQPSAHPADLHNQGDEKAKKLAQSLTDDQVAWLKNCPVILKIGELPGIHGEVVVIHGGLVPGVALDKQDPFQVMNMRSIDLDTRVPSELRIGEPWEKVWNHFQKQVKSKSHRMTAIYGHDAKRGLNIKEYSKGLDSNCVRGGRLTALVIDGKGHEKLFDVKCHADDGYDVKKKKKDKNAD